MSKTSFTHEPWEIGVLTDHAGSKHLAIAQKGAGNGGPFICVLSDMEKTTNEDYANANLVISAPDLLAACQALPLAKFADEDNLDAADFVDNCTSFLEAMRLARAAIAKATGATQ